MGQLQAIEHQTVIYGDDIKQYALVNVMQNGNSFIKPCEDCICYISIMDNKNHRFVNNNLMHKVELGLYGYKALASEIPVGGYLFYANCTSALYTDGIEISDLIITDATLIPNAENTSVSCQQYDTCSGLNCIGPGMGCMTDKLSDLVSSIIDIGVSIKDLVLKFDIKTWITYAVSSIITGIIGIFMLPFTLILAPIILFLPVMILLLIILEVCIMGYVVFTEHNKTGFGWVMAWANGHYLLINGLKNLIFRFI